LLATTTGSTTATGRLRVVRVVSGCEAHDGCENKGVPVGEVAVACYYYWLHYCCWPPEGGGESYGVKD